MPQLTGHFVTQNASKYLQQLCKHFSHKVAATYDADHGSVQFVFGPASFHSDNNSLTVSFDLADMADVGAAKHVIDAHLKKFAFRENFETMIWSEPAL